MDESYSSTSPPCFSQLSPHHKAGISDTQNKAFVHKFKNTILYFFFFMWIEKTKLLPNNETDNQLSPLTLNFNFHHWTPIQMITQ